MKDFLKKIINGNGVVPSQVCLQAFAHNFTYAINTEWYHRDDFFEAIFYKDEHEYIALFDLRGRLISYKLNLPAAYLPAPLKELAESKGEIMNVLMNNKGNKVEYEVIVRDQELIRYSLTLAELGQLIEEKML